MSPDRFWEPRDNLLKNLQHRAVPGTKDAREPAQAAPSTFGDFLAKWPSKISEILQMGAKFGVSIDRREHDLYKITRDGQVIGPRGPLKPNKGFVSINGKSKSVGLMVYNKFVGPAKAIRHKDGNPNNNHVDNLVPTTWARLTPQDREAIKASGKPAHWLAQQYGTSIGTIYRIRNGH